jgi:p90 ribosomal S6 kinase
MKQKVFSEREASAVMKTITSTVSYLHNNDIAHRDLKPSNILYADDSGDPTTIRIVDFGFAKQLRHENGLLMTPCFTKSYGAPEVLSRQAYDVSCDIWSLGCILYTMLVGITPFSITPNDSEQTILKKLNEGNIGFEGKSWNGISDEAKDLLRKMLSFDANSRPNAKQVLDHGWIKNGHNLPEKNLASLQSPVDLTKAIGSSINVVNQARGGGNGLQLAKLNESGLFNRRMKKLKFPSPLKF